MAQIIQHKTEPLEDLMNSIRRILHLSFQDKEPTLGLMVTLVAFAGDMAAERLMLGGSIEEAEGFADAATDTIQTYGGAWLMEKQGWENMPSMPPSRQLGPEQARHN